MTKMSIHRRLAREKKTIHVMMQMYCRAKHGRKNDLCAECSDLENYALTRIEKCPYGPDKPSCAVCPTHCYKAAMRTEIKKVMRFSGPRMIWRHPWLAIMHLIDEKRKVASVAEKNKILG